MAGRFAVRRSARGHGVWDAAVSGWRSEQDLSEEEAARVARELAARFGDSGPGRADPPPGPGVRLVDPPRPVLVLQGRTWWPGRLDRWTLQPDGWYGHVLLETGGRSWYPAKLLRPQPDVP